MDEIIGLLFLVVPVLFSLIGKKLEKAGGGKGAEASQAVPPACEAEEAPRSVMESQPLKSRLHAKVSAVGSVQAADVHEEEKTRGKDPIDPKKLVIYSEIMKPKFKE